MKREFKIILFVSILLLLTGCSSKLTKIPLDKSILATVNMNDQTLTIIDLDEKEIFTEWKLPKKYTGAFILEDEDTLVLYGKAVDTVDLYSLSKGKKVSSWKTGKGIANGYLLPNKTIAFADQILHQVRFFSMEGREIGSVFTGKNPSDMVEDQNSDRILHVISFDDKRMSAIDYKKKKVLTSSPIHKNAAGAYLAKEANEIWIGGHGTGSEVEDNIHVYDLSTGYLLKLISAPSMPIEFVSQDKMIYALSHGTSIVYKFDQRGYLNGSLSVGANPFEMTIYEKNLIIAGYDSNDITFVHLDSFSISNVIHVGDGPIQIIVRESKR